MFHQLFLVEWKKKEMNFPSNFDFKVEAFSCVGFVMICVQLAAYVIS